MNACHEAFPEQRAERTDLTEGTDPEGHRLNLFFPRMIPQDGTGMETLNNIGHHELHDYFTPLFDNDPSVTESFSSNSGKPNQNRLINLFQIQEAPLNPISYYEIDAPEFATHTSAQIVAPHSPPSLNLDLMSVDYITCPDHPKKIKKGQTGMALT